MFFLSFGVLAQDYDREKRWADEIVPSLMAGDAVWLEQKNGHKFLGLFIERPNSNCLLYTSDAADE